MHVDLETAWKEECAAAERLREAQTAAAKAAHELSLKQLQRKRLETEATSTDARLKPHATRRSSAAKRFAGLYAWSIVTLVAVGIGGFAYWGWATFNVRVCSTSMTSGVARDLLRAYQPNFPYHYTLAADNAGPCEVRFYTGTNDPASLIARDGVVAIVNPKTPIHQLSVFQLREIFAGRIDNWSNLGAAPAPIVAEMPPDGSDEARAATALIGGDIGSSIRRSSAAEIAKFVASPSGKNAIAFVPFSAAHGAKVVTIAGSPPPTSLSIAHEQYPLSLGLMAESDFRRPSAGANALIAFARSHDAHLVLARANMITKGIALGDPSRP